MQRSSFERFPDLVSTRAALERVLRSKPDARNLRIYLGYTGWGPGQLEHEMNLDVWRVLPADAESVFAADPVGGLAAADRADGVAIRAQRAAFPLGTTCKW